LGNESKYLLNLLAISYFGYMFSTFFLANCSGGRYWQTNWENNIELLEVFFSGNLYKTNLYKKSKRYSVSRINEYTIIFILISWFILTLYLLPMYIENHWVAFLMILFSIVFVILMFSSYSKNEDNIIKMNVRKITIRSKK